MADEEFQKTKLSQEQLDGVWKAISQLLDRLVALEKKAGTTALCWTTALPTEPGYYWTCLEDKPHTMNVCQVLRNERGWQVFFPGAPARPLSVLSGPRVWYGPIWPPE